MAQRPMHGVVFYRLAVFAPFALPVAGLLLTAPLSLIGLPGANAAVTIFGFLFVAAWIGGLPYLVTAGIVLWRLRRASATAHQHAAWLIPLPYSALLGLIGFVVSITEVGTGAFAAIGIGAAWALCGLSFGYAYVI